MLTEIVRFVVEGAGTSRTLSSFTPRLVKGFFGGSRSRQYRVRFNAPSTEVYSSKTCTFAVRCRASGALGSRRQRASGYLRARRARRRDGTPARG